MFRKNKDHHQERINSTVKNLPDSLKRELEKDWSTTFYKYVFNCIDEEKFASLYDTEGFSRPNKPVNVLISLEIMKEMFDWSDKELRKEYFFNLRVNNAIGKEEIGKDTLAEKTIYNFRTRLLQLEQETETNLMKEVFKDFRDDIMEEFNIDGRLQRTDSTLVEANIKNLTRLNLFVRVLHNFLNDLSEAELNGIPDEICVFKEEKNLDLSYRLKKEGVKEKLKEMARYIAWIKDRFENNVEYNKLKSYEHVCRVLNEQCYRIPELEDYDECEDEEDDGPVMWESVKKWGEKKGDSKDENEQQKEILLKEPKDVRSDSLQNPYDDEATYREKNGEMHWGYKSNWFETCGRDNPFQIITDVDVDTNNTEDVEMLEREVEELALETGLEYLLCDGGYSGKDVEEKCDAHGVTQHFSGIKGRAREDERIPLGEVEFDYHEILKCPEGHMPYIQKYNPDSKRYWGRFKKDVCGKCELKDKCFVVERKGFYSYGFYHRQIVVARRRAMLKDPEYRKFLQLRSGAESMINEVYHKSGKRTKYTGKQKVKRSEIAKAIGVNVKRVARYLTKTRKKVPLPMQTKNGIVASL